MFFIFITNLFWIIYIIFEGIKESTNDINLSLCKIETFNTKKVRIINYTLFLILCSFLLYKEISIYFIPWIIGQILIFNFIKKLSYNCIKNNFNKTSIVKHKMKKIKKKEKTFFISGLIIQLITYLAYLNNFLSHDI